jgi:DNA repair exonuclease SbcCD ATPase subunit
MKKTDLIERLRQNPNYTYWLDIAEAADELEAMQTRVAEIEEIFDDILEDLAHRRFALIKTGIEREKQLRERIAELEAQLKVWKPDTSYDGHVCPGCGRKYEQAGGRDADLRLDVRRAADELERLDAEYLAEAELQEDDK